MRIKKEQLEKEMKKIVLVAVKDLMEEMKELESLAENKRQTREKMLHEVEQRKQDISLLNSEAAKILANGGDPLPLFGEVAEKTAALEAFGKLIPKEDAVDFGEREKIDELREELNIEIAKALRGSKLRHGLMDDLEKEFTEIKEFIESWEKITKDIYRQHGIWRNGDMREIRMGIPYQANNSTMILACWFSDFFKGVKGAYRFGHTPHKY